MRRAGRQPDYPIGKRAAQDRLAVLRRRVREQEAALARGDAVGEEAWAELEGWQEEARGLADALLVLDEVLPTLARCGCGKRVHESIESATRHARCLRFIDERRDGRRVDVYECDYVRRAGVWHVGHDRPPPDRRRSA